MFVVASFWWTPAHDHDYDNDEPPKRGYRRVISVAATVLDWSSLLRQTTDASFYSDKPANVVGFITTDTGDPQNVFSVSRFVITCCAVDAQLVGVPVYLPNWQNTFATDQWVKVSGSFETNPSTKSQQSIALVPNTTTRVDQPSEPYLY